MKNTNTYQKGLTLIEIMLALSIGIFITGGIIQLFINSKKTYELQDGLSRVQENGRFAIYTMQEDVRMLGYWGCMTNASGDLVGVEGNNKSDSVLIRSAFDLTISNTIPLDCGSSIDKTASYYTNELSTIKYEVNSQNELIRYHPYIDGKQIMNFPAECHLSIVADASLTPENTHIGSCAVMAESVYDMQIVYGEDTDTTPDYTVNRYINADQVSSIDKVLSMRIYILLASQKDQLTTTPVNYFFKGQEVTASDKKLWRVFTSTIALRNRIPST